MPRTDKTGCAGALKRSGTVADISSARWLSPMHPPDTAAQKHSAPAHRLSVAPMMELKMFHIEKQCLAKRRVHRMFPS
jgi:hypothetical protein